MSNWTRPYLKRSQRAGTNYILWLAFLSTGLATAYATTSYMNGFRTAYPAAVGSQIDSCGLCHVNPAGGGTRNSYGEAFRTAGHSFTAIENLDSDGDGFTNLQEIQALTFPGNAASHPAVTPPPPPSGADTTPPSITAFSIPSTSTTLQVNINLFSATDNVAVTAFLLTSTAATPSLSAAGWTSSVPASYTFASSGVQTVYAWARDAAGNISASRAATTTITLAPTVDRTRPTVTSFSVPSVSGATTISILTYAATDNVGVTGYLLTESSTVPSAGSIAWAPVPIWRYTFATAGAKTLYAWAKDASGNVSAPAIGKTTVAIPPISGVPKSINSTSRNRLTPPPTQVSEQPLAGLAAYQVVAANDLGMHCGDLDQRVASILPPFNVLHAQVIRKGLKPQVLDSGQAEVVYSAASNPQDPAQAGVLPASVYKTNFWNINPLTGRPIAFDAFDPYYPPGILALFQLLPDIGLPVPDLQRLYLGDGVLAADQQKMPVGSGTNLVSAPQRFALYYRNLPFFKNFPFGYSLSGVNWFSAEGIPVTPFDDAGRPNSYPLMRVQARSVSGNTLGVAAGTVMASVDTVVPVAGEVDCKNCHSSAVDGGSGIATDGLGFTVATRYNDPLYGKVPAAVSIEWAFDTNILRLHDANHGTKLQSSTPVSCQKCHYTPALDLAHLGPQDVNGRQQTTHSSFSRVMHSFHGSLGLFPEMPSPAGRPAAVRDDVLNKTCYQCHPGRNTQCFRGAMYEAGQACQDCHGNMMQVGNDFSGNVASGGAFVVAGDYYTNAGTPRIPWANEPMCQSCHTGDTRSNLAGSTNVVKAADGIRLIQAYRTGDANAKPLVATNRRFAENQTGSGSTTKQVLFRLSRGHGGVFCEGCHGSTHAEWPNAIANANDNVAATQLQGHSGKIVECATCHGSTPFATSSFRRNFDANGWMKGPHGMHPVDQSWISGHHDVYGDNATPAGTCQACHGSQLQGSPLAKTAADRTFRVDDGATRTIKKGTQVSCTLCHENPLTHR